MHRYYSVVLIVFLGSASGMSFAWLGERVQQEIEDVSEFDQLETTATTNSGNKEAVSKPWIASDVMMEQQKKYRDQLKKRWPNAQRSVRVDGLTYYPDHFNSSVSIQFSTNKIEIVIPRKRQRSDMYDQLAERQKASQYLEQLLGMKRSELFKLLESELMLDSSQIKLEGRSDELILQELFKGKPTQSDVNKMAHKILQTARIQVADKAMNTVFVKEDRITFIMNMPSTRLEAAAKKYQKIIAEYSTEFVVPESLILAVMHTESHFNPLAKSSIPAFGLMQIVPTTAGLDAATVLYEQLPELSPEFLFQERNNIQLGAAYLNILYYRYLKRIKNERSRAYVTIAAYNAGPSNIARAFVSVPRMSEAVAVINDMTDQEVLHRMLNYAPSKETRQYLSKTVAREEYYRRAITYWE